MSRGQFRVGADIGGTFTDLVVLGHDGTLYSKKVSSTVGQYESAIAQGLADLFIEVGLAASEVTEVLHATTVASNAILEHRGAKTGLITTEGFRDILEIRNLRMPRLYDLHWEKPVPLVDRYLRATVNERIDHLGAVQTPLDLTEAARVVDNLLAEGVEAIAVCLINSYANDRHERQIKQLIEERAPDLIHCISFDVLPEINEYHRTSTTVINAYIMPIVSSYLERLAERLQEIDLKQPFLLYQDHI